MKETNNMDYVIREGEKRDCKDIVHVVTIAWNETYRGIVNDEFLNNMKNTEEERTKNMINNFHKNNNYQYVLETKGKIIGFIRICKSNECIENCGEIQALYIINEYQGKGYGKKLVEQGIKKLKQLGFKSMVIGCLQGNPTNEFYKYLGGKVLKQIVFSIPNQDIDENIYFYNI